MLRRRILGGSGVLLVVIALSMSLAGCGDGGAHETKSTGEVKIVDPVNPKPGYIPAEDEYKQQTPAAK
jgi:hypothetical protein